MDSCLLDPGKHLCSCDIILEMRIIYQILSFVGMVSILSTVVPIVVFGSNATDFVTRFSANGWQACESLEK